MKRQTARKLHEAANLTYWFGNPEWHTGDARADAVLDATRPFWQGVHKAVRRTFFDADQILAISGESVVAPYDDKVRKYMFRYPGNKPLKEFETTVAGDVALTTAYLRIALPTLVSIEQARVFRNPRTYVEAVAQTQSRLNLSIHGAIDLEAVADEAASLNKDRTARDLEGTLRDTERLIAQKGRYPDLARSGGNVRRSTEDGSLTLIDVMPFYEDGSRAIGDSPPGAIESINRNISRYEEFVGQYGG